MVYLDNAATGGRKPREVIRAVENALIHHSANPGRSGHKLSMAASELMYNTRKKAADFFGCDRVDGVCFTSGCTASLNFAVKGFLRPGDHAIISSLEHNAVVRPMHLLKAAGVKVDTAEVIFGDNEATVRSFVKLMQPNTKLVVCTHASNVTGTVLPIRDIGKECRKRGIVFVVDAAQSAGVLPINMEEDNIDILCAAPHKGLMAPMGLGLMISRTRIPHTLIEGGTGSMSVDPNQPEDLPERFESGTVNLPAIAGLSAGLDFINRSGRQRLYQKELALMDRAYEGLSRTKGVTLHSPKPQAGVTCPVLSFNIEGMPSTAAASKLDETGIAVRGGLHCAPSAHKRLGTLDTGTVRIATSYFNTESDIAALLQAVRHLSK